MVYKANHLLTMAVEDDIRQSQNLQLLKAINQAYDDFPDQEERTLLNKMRQRHKSLVDKEDFIEGIRALSTSRE